MPTPPNARSVRISDDERGGWSSDRPRPGGRPPRPVDVSVRGRVLTPSDELRYSPGSLLVIVSASKDQRDALVQRVLESPGAVLSLDKVRGLLQGRVADDEIDERAVQLLDAAALKRFEAGDTVVLAAEGLDAAERERFVRMAHRFRRPRHLSCSRRRATRWPTRTGARSTTCAAASTRASSGPTASRPRCAWAAPRPRSS